VRCREDVDVDEDVVLDGALEVRKSNSQSLLLTFKEEDDDEEESVDSRRRWLLLLTSDLDVVEVLWQVTVLPPEEGFGRVVVLVAGLERMMNGMSGVREPRKE
jgi:hypothetical protein